MKILRIIFPDSGGVYAGGIKERHIRENRVYLLTDGFGDTNQTVPPVKLLSESLLKSCDFRGIQNLIEAAELVKVMRVMKEGQDMESRKCVEESMPRVRLQENIYGNDPQKHRNSSGRKQKQFHQDGYGFQEDPGNEVYQDLKFPGNQNKYLP